MFLLVRYHNVIRAGCKTDIVPLHAVSPDQNGTPASVESWVPQPQDAGKTVWVYRDKDDVHLKARLINFKSSQSELKRLIASTRLKLDIVKNFSPGYMDGAQVARLNERRQAGVHRQNIGKARLKVLHTQDANVLRSLEVQPFKQRKPLHQHTKDNIAQGTFPKVRGKRANAGQLRPPAKRSRIVKVPMESDSDPDNPANLSDLDQAENIKDKSHSTMVCEGGAVLVHPKERHVTTLKNPEWRGRRKAQVVEPLTKGETHPVAPEEGGGQEVNGGGSNTALVDTPVSHGDVKLHKKGRNPASEVSNNKESRMAQSPLSNSQAEVLDELFDFGSVRKMPAPANSATMGNLDERMSKLEGTTSTLVTKQTELIECVKNLCMAVSDKRNGAENRDETKSGAGSACTDDSYVPLPLKYRCLARMAQSLRSRVCVVAKALWGENLRNLALYGNKKPRPDPALLESLIQHMNYYEARHARASAEEKKKVILKADGRYDLPPALIRRYLSYAIHEAQPHRKNRKRDRAAEKERRGKGLPRQKRSDVPKGTCIDEITVDSRDVPILEFPQNVILEITPNEKFSSDGNDGKKSTETGVAHPQKSPTMPKRGDRECHYPIPSPELEPHHGEQECPLCQDPGDTFLNPCNHLFCALCAESISVCSVCLKEKTGTTTTARCDSSDTGNNDDSDGNDWDGDAVEGDQGGSDDPFGECEICGLIVDCKVKPCLHQVLCTSCATLIESCSLCGTVITGVVNL